MYLLLNELKFPGSNGYYSVAVQYNSDFVFPAPTHASEGMTRIIRKMCSFYSEERYQTMSEVLADLSRVLDSEDIEDADELFELADVATVTFREEHNTENKKDAPKERRKTRAERKEERRIVDVLYCVVPCTSGSSIDGGIFSECKRVSFDFWCCYYCSICYFHLLNWSDSATYITDDVRADWLPDINIGSRCFDRIVDAYRIYREIAVPELYK